MAYNRNYRGGYGRNSRRGTGGSRWMDLRYNGTCKVCKRKVPAGDRAFYDAETKSITCHNIECCVADGLTRQAWIGSPVDGQFVPERTEKRFGPAFAVPDALAVGSRSYMGRCEDAPCCGCCD